MLHNKKLLNLAFAMTLSIGATIFAAENTITVETIVTVNPVAIEEQLIMREHIIEEPKTTSCKCCCMTDTDSKGYNSYNGSSSAQPAKVASTILHKITDDFTISSDAKLTAKIKENNKNDDMKLILTTTNLSDSHLSIDQKIEMHKWVNGDWYLMQNYDPSYPEIDMYIAAGAEYQEEVNLSYHFGILENGTYRMIKCANYLMDEYIIAEFTIE
ncbi:hypothetical protein AN641_05400 [Candidatus Epulonipiscioides gigas]|nr:hypothetical protein AN641_05400 [Epulopiscium sp. SCG-C07WGA-EpuloA2]